MVILVYYYAEMLSSTWIRLIFVCRSLYTLYIRYRVFPGLGITLK